MDNLNLEHHVKLRNLLLKKQIWHSDKIRALSSIDLANASFITKEVVRIELENARLEVINLQRDINAQEAIINSYMDNLE